MFVHRINTMDFETQFLHLRQPVPLGARIGGWDRPRFFLIVMVEKVKRGGRHAHRS